MTFLTSILDALGTAAQFNQNYEAGPVCVLWPDKERLWEPLAKIFREQSRAFFQLGKFAPDQGTGSALWLKCVLAGLVDGIELPEDAVPVLYLPGVGRSDFRDVESCPPELQPLIELQHRGVIWAHVNGKDWTVSGFLSANEGGLGLDVAKDQRTSVALQQALTKLADVPIQRLQGQQIDADFLLALLHPDPSRELLRWLNSSGTFAKSLAADQWNAFTAVCRGTYQFDPDKDGEIRAAELLGAQKGAWREVWNRFREAPHRYPGIPEWLRRACPPKQMELSLEEQPYDGAAEAWPQVNEEGERSLREALDKISGRAAHDIRKAVLTNETQHAPRRAWVWAELGQSPMAKVWEHLADLARRSEKPIAGGDLDGLAELYETEGWRTDGAVVSVLAQALTEADRVVVGKIVRALYLPWIEETTQNFQHLAKQKPAVFSVSAPSMPPAGTVLVFADALRLDVGQALYREIADLGFEVTLTHRWSPIPSVTPTAKPAASPIAHLLGGDLAPDKQDVIAFRPAITSEHKGLTPDRFRKLLHAADIQFLDPMEVGNPDGVAWTEHGRLDADGHHEGARVSLRCAEHLRILVERVQALAAAGWRSIRIVTDHGWLLMPGGLPSVPLPKFLAESKWGRCAVLTEGAQSTLPHWNWAWSPSVQIACPPGVSSFVGGLEYTHGGLSLQECRIPEIHVRNSGAVVAPKVRLVSVKWVNLRCRVTLEGDFGGVTVDLRLRPADAGSTVVEAARSADAAGIASLLLVRDELVGSSASAVVVASDGKVVQKLSLILGENT